MNFADPNWLVLAAILDNRLMRLTFMYLRTSRLSILGATNLATAQLSTALGLFL